MLFLKIRRSFYIIGWPQCFEFFSIYIRPKKFVKYIFLLSLMSSIQRCINHWKNKFAQILNFPHLTHLHFFIQTLTKLHLSNNQIGDAGAQHLADALRNNTVILILSSSISYTHLHFFIQTLTTLDLNHNQIGDAGAQHLADALRNNTVTLILSSSISYTHLHFFTQTLITLDLWNNHIGDAGAQHLADALRNNTVILILSSSISYTHLHFFT
jgi:Ran GTPase-activating protein (RanGAP) involved in mRNA processing and transport